LEFTFKIAIFNVIRGNCDVVTSGKHTNGRITMENQEKEIYQKIAGLCSKSEQCTPDIRKKIRALGGDSILEERIVTRLTQEKFLSDERYAGMFASEKFRINKWGKVKIRYYLKLKGLDEQVIQPALASIDDREYVNLLVKTLKEKAKSIKSGTSYEKTGQLIRFAQGRGFEPELIHRYLDKAN